MSGYLEPDYNGYKLKIINLFIMVKKVLKNLIHLLLINKIHI